MFITVYEIVTLNIIYQYFKLFKKRKEKKRKEKKRKEKKRKEKKRKEKKRREKKRKEEKKREKKRKKRKEEKRKEKKTHIVCVYVCVRNIKMLLWDVPEENENFVTHARIIVRFIITY